MRSTASNTPSTRFFESCQLTFKFPFAATLLWFSNACAQQDIAQFLHGNISAGVAVLMVCAAAFLTTLARYWLDASRYGFSATKPLRWL